MVNSLLKAREGGDPRKPKKATTQAEIDAANTEAKRFALARGLVSGEDTYVARVPGDRLPEYIDAETGKPYVPIKTKPKAMSLPPDIKLEDIKSDGSFFWYDDPRTGDMVDIDPLAFNVLKYRKTKEQIAADTLYRQGLMAKK